MSCESNREQFQTVRQQIIELLSKEELSAMEISKSLGIREKEVYEHLGNIGRSVSSRGKKLVTASWRCLKCGYVFLDRKRYNRPGRCPKCKETHIQSARYKVVDLGRSASGGHVFRL